MPGRLVLQFNENILDNQNQNQNQKEPNQNPKTQKIPTTCFVDEMPVQQIQSGNEKLMGILI